MSVFTEAKTVDAKKIIRLINTGLNAQLNEAAQCVKNAGSAVGRQWNLITLQKNNEVLIEDVNSNQLLTGVFASKPTPQLSNITPLQIVDESKSDFFDSCYQLVESIESGDPKAIQQSFNKMAMQRFTSKIVPETKKVKCRDGGIYNIPVSESRSITKADIVSIVEAAKQHYSNNVVIKEGKIVSYKDASDKLQINNWLPRRVMARNLKEAAVNSYKNPKFVKSIVESVCQFAKGDVKESLLTIGKVLQENEEYTLLTESEFVGLVKNCLATEAVFNSKLAEDYGTSAHKLNLSLNKDTIISEWTNIAKSAGSTVLLENVNKLSRSNNFEYAHGKFITAIFETAGGRDTQVLMLRSTLQKMANDVNGIKDDPGLKQKITGLIDKLKSPNIDESTIFEAEDVVAAVGDELKDTDSLDNFDDFNDDDLSTLDDAAGDATAADPSVGSQQPVININSPLIQIGGSSGSTSTGDADVSGLPDDLADLGGDSDEKVEDIDTAGLGENGDLGDDAAGDDPLAGGDEDEDATGFDALTGSGDEEEKKKGGLFESKSELSLLRSYGQKPLKKAGVLREVVESIGYAVSLLPEGTNPSIMSIASMAIDKVGVSVPKSMRFVAINEAVEAYEMEQANETVEDIPVEENQLHDPNTPTKGYAKDAINPVEEDQLHEVDSPTDGLKKDSINKLNENQIHDPNAPKAGLKKDAVNPYKLVEWVEVGENDSKGICEGVKFVLRHQNIGSMVVENDNGSVTIPVPVNLSNSALSSMKLSSGDSKKFNVWLKNITESIKPISEFEDEEVDNDVALLDGNDDMEFDDSDDMAPVPTHDDPLQQAGINPGDDMFLVAPKSGVVLPVSVSDVEEVEHDFDVDDLDESEESDEENESDESDELDDEESEESETEESDESEESEEDEESDENESEESDEDESEESEEDEKSDGKKDKPAFLKEEDNRPDFLKKKDAENKPEGKEETITEDPEFDRGETGDSYMKNNRSQEVFAPTSNQQEFSFYWHGDMTSGAGQWIDGEDNVPAPEAIQNVANRIGLNDKIIRGEIQPENVIYNLVVDYATTRTDSLGDHVTPGSSSVSADVNSMKVQVTFDGADGQEHSIDVQLTESEYRELVDYYDDYLANKGIDY